MAKKGQKDKAAGKTKDPTEALWNTEEGRQKLKLMKQASLRVSSEFFSSREKLI